MSLTPGTRFGPCEIVAPLGAGGMGEVYRARDTRLKRDVAIKVLGESFSYDADRRARFQREAELLASLNHPNIAAIYGLEEADDISAIVMELVEGETLAERIARSPLPVDEALPIARQIVDALEAAHEKGVVHRDLKPANIKLTSDGKVKVLDFGLAKALDPAGSSSSPTMTQSPTMSVAATRAGMILGTAAYMSPEQARGKPVDRRTDIWAFGCVLFEMLTGKQTFEAGDTVSDAVAAILRSEPDWTALPASTPPHIRTLLRRCLQKDPQKRLPHIGIARIEIDEGEAAVAQGFSPADGSAVPAPPGLKARPMRILPWLAAAMLLALSLALAFVVVTHREPEAAAIRFTIDAPEGSRFGHVAASRGTNPPAPHHAVSPDGRLLAYVMATGDTVRLWIRRLDALEGQPVAGTDDASFAFWSPDSRFVGFFAQGKLKKVDVAGGPPQTIADAPGGEGGTWNRAGDIVFAPNQRGALFRVSSAGGAASPVTTLDKTLKETGHSWPQFLPDGRRFIYHARGAGDEHRAIYAGSLDTSARTLVMKDVPRAAYGSGHLLFTRDTALMAQPFDPTSLTLSGEPQRVADVAISTGGRAGFTVSEGGVLVYRRSRDESDAEPQMAWFDRSGKRLEAVGPRGRYGEMALSPDNRSVAVSRGTGPRAPYDIWVVDLSRAGIPTRVTFGPEDDSDPRWSPDGKRIAFAANNDLFEKPSSGSGDPRLLLKSPRRKLPGDWSSDGEIFFYQEDDPQTKSDLWIVRPAGDGKPSAFLRTPFNEGNPRPSPDGRWVAYQSDEGGAVDVYVRPFQATDQKWRISPGGGVAPQWRRDGRELFYETRDRTIMAVEVLGTTTFQAGVPKPLFDIPGSGQIRTRPGNYAVSRDGQRFLVIERPERPSTSPLTVVVNWTAGLLR